MKYFFILGRNPELSKLEIISFFESRDIYSKQIIFDENLLVLDILIDSIDIKEFGGVIKLGKIIFEGNEKEFGGYLDKNEIIESDKFTYFVFGNIDFDLLKEKFKREKKKAMLKHGRKQIKFQDGEKINLSNAEFSLFLYGLKDKILLGIVDQDFYSSETEYRDMKKPIRREALAISPRLSKILINLSGAKKEDLLIDPFCGVGGILQEALLKGINVYGIDKDLSVIKDAEENLKWLKEKFEFKTKYTLDKNDSRRAPNLKFDAIATETPLGILLKKKPQDNEAKKIIFDFEEFIIPILARLKKVKRDNAKIAIIFPVIRKFRVNVNKISKESGLNIVYGPIEEFREDQYISRDIVVFR